MAPLFSAADAPPAREVFFWEHEGNAAVRRGPWKLVRDYPEEWELYNIEEDRPEVHDLAQQHPEIVAELNDLWQEWAERCHVMEWNALLQRRAKAHNVQLKPEQK